MSFKLFLTFIAFLALVNLGTPLKCYLCNGDASSNCAKGRTSSMSSQTCAGSLFSLFPQIISNDKDIELGENLLLTQTQTVCLEFYATDYRKYGRGCGTYPADEDPCTYLEKRVHLRGCRSCKTDFCNNQPGEELESESEPQVNTVF